MMLDDVETDLCDGGGRVFLFTTQKHEQRRFEAPHGNRQPHYMALKCFGQAQCVLAVHPRPGSDRASLVSPE